MQLESTFSIVAPIHQVWETLMDVERVAGCVPGAQVLNKLSDDAYQVGLTVKLGPVSMQYRGQISVVERDAEAHRAVFQGRAQEARGLGIAQGTATLLLVESDGTTRGTVSADVDLSGKVAAMGKSVIGGVTDQMMALFAENLQAMVGTPPTEPSAGPSAGPPAEPPEPAVGATSGPPSRPSPAVQADTGLNAMTVLTGLIRDRLGGPRALFGLLAAVAFVSYCLGRRASRKVLR